LEKKWEKKKPVFGEKENWPFFFFGDFLLIPINKDEGERSRPF